MSSSTRTPTFLLDENVRSELSAWLEERGVACRRLAKGTSDGVLAAVSRKERLPLVTNDKDFSKLTGDKIFAVIWLKVPQNDVSALIASFQKMLEECASFSKRLILVDKDGWKHEPLPRTPRSKRTK